MADNVTFDHLGRAEALPPHYHLNKWLFGLDMGMFQVGMSFMGATTILPAFVATLTSSEVVVGLATGLGNGAWLLPQLLVASTVARLPRKQPMMVRTAWLTRPILLVMALIVWLLGAKAPALTLGVTLTSIFVFYAGDAVVSMLWFDLLARSLPPRRRGRVQGAAQLLGGLGGVGVGVMARFVLSDKSPWAFPADYALLFFMGVAAFFASALAITLIREPRSVSAGQKVPTTRETLISLPRILAQDRPFLQLVLVKLLYGFVSVASAFYVLHATRNLGFGIEDTGLFVSAQVAGSLTSGLFTGVVQDRWGPLVHLRSTIGLAALSPILALCAEPLLGSLGHGLLYLYLAVFFLLGVTLGNIGWPFFNWIFEHAQEAQRPLYIGACNTLGGLAMLAPTLGGWVVTEFSYPAVFALALAFAIAAFVLSLYLPNTRHKPRDIRS